MDFVEAHFQQEIKKFRRLLTSQTRSLSLQGVHDLRVSTRRLRAQVALIEKNSTYKLSARNENALKNLGRALGERRQWDVALKGARKFHLAEENLRRDQTQAGIKLKKVLKSKEVQVLPRDLLELERKLRTEKILIPEKQFKKMRSELKTWLKQKRFSIEELHELRISTKKIRYAFECLDLPVEDLKELQDHLGKSHDLTVLREYFKDPKVVRKADRKERKAAEKRVRPALSSSLEVLNLLR